MSEIRRSSRSNKGKNSRLEEQVRYEELNYKQNKKSKKSNGNDADADDDEVLCTVCGTTDDNYDPDEDNGDMIQCEDCHTWQHTQCIFGDENKVPDSYICNVCDPNNKLYKDLTFELDPETIMLKKRKRKSINGNGNGHNHTKEKEYKDKLINDQDEEDDNDNLSDDYSSKPKRKKSKSGIQHHIQPKSSDDDIDNKTRDAVKKRFEGMFKNLLIPGTKIPDESDPLDSLSNKWASKLEQILFNTYHNKETMKLTKEYKEVSTRVFVNIKDEKNIKLRNSIINKTISFEKLVKMPVNELLNPDLRKEKEDAIKESMTSATLELPTMSNIRRTHKGDIVLEKEENDPNLGVDFNVGISLDNDDKKFIKSENTVTVLDRKSSIYDNYHDDGNDHIEENHEDDDQDGDHGIDINEDEELLQILGEETEKKNEIVSKIIWTGQTIFIGVTNFPSEIKLITSTLSQSQISQCSNQLFDQDLPMEIEGRLDLRKADDYISKVSQSRKLIILELESDSDKNYEKLFQYFHTRAKVGVIKQHNPKPFIKDSYIFPITSTTKPRFLKDVQVTEGKLIIVFVVKQELIKDQIEPPSMEFLDKLSPKVLEIVNKIFDDVPETRINSGLLINLLKKRVEE